MALNEPERHSIHTQGRKTQSSDITPHTIEWNLQHLYSAQLPLPGGCGLFAELLGVTFGSGRGYIGFFNRKSLFLFLRKSSGLFRLYFI